MFGLLVTVLILLVAGLVGGLTNYLLYPDKATNTLFTKLLTGISAAFVVPLVLHFSESNLLQKCIKNPSDCMDEYLVLFSLSLVAGLSSKAFLQAVSKKWIEQIEKKADAADSCTQDLVKTFLESEVNYDKKDVETATPKTYQLLEKIDNNTIDVLKKMRDSPYRYHTNARMATYFNKEIIDTKAILESLETQGIVGHTIMTGLELWYVSHAALIELEK